MVAFPILIYLILCLIVGFMGRDRRSGYLGTVALAILITPFLAFIGLTLLEQRSAARIRDRSADEDPR